MVEQSLKDIGLGAFAPYLMNRIMGRYNTSLRAEMAQLGLTTPKMRSLAILSVMDGILIRELAIFTVTEQSTLSRALDGMERDGLIRREADSQDSRATRIFLTDTGQKTFKKIWPKMAQSHDHMFNGITPNERADFVTTLQKILRNVRKHEI